MKFNSFNQTKKSQRGVSLFDFVLWLTIAGIFIGMVYAIFGPSRTQVRSQAVVTDIQMMQAAIRPMFANSTSGYNLLDLKALSDAKLLPTTIKASDKTNGSSQEGGAFTLKCSKDGVTYSGCSGATTGDISTTYEIKFASIDQSACTLLIQKLEPTDWNKMECSGKSGTGTLTLQSKS